MYERLRRDELVGFAREIIKMDIEMKELEYENAELKAKLEKRENDLDGIFASQQKAHGEFFKDVLSGKIKT